MDDADRVLIADEQNQRILRYHPKEDTVIALLGKRGIKPNRSLSKPHGVAVHADGSVYVVGTGHHRVLRLMAP